MNIRTFIIAAIICLTPLAAMADAVGSWTIYPSFYQISDIEPAGSTIYVVASGNLYAYNTNDNSLQTYDKTNVLSSIDIQHISYNTAAKRLVIVYADYDIDLLSPDGDITNVPDLRMKVMTGDKTINSITQSGQYAYLSTGFGIVKLDVKNAYIADSYNLSRSITHTAIIGNDIYALKGDHANNTGIIHANTNDNLSDPASWTSLTSTVFGYLFAINGQLIGMTDGNANTIDTTTADIKPFAFFPFTWAKTYGNTILCGTGNQFAVINPDLSSASYPNQDHTLNIVAYDQQKKTFWTNSDKGRLIQCTIDDDNQLQPNGNGVIPEGPASNYSYRLTFDNDRLFVTAGGWAYWIANMGRDGQIMQMDNDGRWSEFESEGLEALAGGRYKDINAVAVDPTDHDHIMVSGMNGLYEFQNQKCVRRYGTADGLITYDKNPAKEYHVICTAVKYDSAGTLWVANSGTDYPLYYMPKGSTTLTNVDDCDITGYTTYTNDIEGITFDGDNIWFGNEKYLYPALYRYSRTDNKVYSTTAFYNQDGLPCTVGSVYTTAKDLNGNIWVGTRIGPFYIKPEDVSSWTLTQHKVPRNDGTNLADYLLSDIPVRAIAVDAANRKWIGTDSNGLFLISDDCNTQLQHFTTENSPLPSDCVYDIAIDGTTGRVFISTSNGLCSYMSDATETTEEMTKDNVWAYPNPVTPDFTGVVTIVGLEFGSQVIITTASGQKVAEGKSNGGSFTWNTCDLNGNRVASGIYMVNIAKADGTKGVVTKIAVVR